MVKLLSQLVEVLNWDLSVWEVPRTDILVWSSNVSKAARSPVMQLMESGNLVVKERNDNNLERTLWESFDYPGDSFLPEMKIGRNFITGFEMYLTYWKNTVLMLKFVHGEMVLGIPKMNSNSRT
ncbi:hypothetical protein V6N13_036206 [Hibiscus sabdariffa]|uniref:Bulb-type lectin domain-containing protein n=1 Tax=Hibiscus sabdariffa TaxID=183260 RepID=A0ABR2S760_9ROSI